jgi:hypothetical protein
VAKDFSSIKALAGRKRGPAKFSRSHAGQHMVELFETFFLPFE